MGKWLLAVLVGLAVVLLALLYVFGGLKHYLRAVSEIKKLSGEARMSAEYDFYNDHKDSFSGILGWVWGKYVWVWGSGKIKTFATDEHTVYSYTNGCREEILNPTGEPKAVSFERDIYTDIAVWKEKAQSGDFVIVALTEENEGGKAGNIREVLAQDWWSFLPGSMQKLCAK